MTNQRWTVRRLKEVWLQKLWIVDGPKIESRRFSFGQTFASWSEAMDYADKMSRTVQVTLPRKPALDLMYECWRADRWDPYMHLTFKKRGDTINLEEVALALLAHQHRMKDK